MGDEKNARASGEVVDDDYYEEPKKGFWKSLFIPIDWLTMLATETHWSFVIGVLIVYGISQGLGRALNKVSTEYYMKDVQKVQPSESQIYSGIIYLPWMVKPVWGIFTDVVPVLGYRRRPYFVLAGLLGMISMLSLALHEKLHLVLAIASLTAGSAGVAIADVTIDACVAQNSNIHPAIAADMQSLCALSSATGALFGFSISGILVHLIGPEVCNSSTFDYRSVWIVGIPFGLVLLVGILLDEPHSPGFDYRKVNQNFVHAGKSMLTTMKCPEIWRLCLYMYSSFALCLNISEGMFYWYIDSNDGPKFSQETVGFVFSIGSVGSLLGAILYQYILKDHPFRDLLFWTQLLFGLSGMLDLVLVLRLNLRFGIPDYFFIVVDESVYQFIGKLKWMPLLVLSSKLCPKGIEGTFFALLMSIDNVGLVFATWGGGSLLRLLSVTRTEFDKLWLAILIRNGLRLSLLCLLFLVPAGNQNSTLLPTRVMGSEEDDENAEPENVELVSLVKNTEEHS